MAITDNFAGQEKGVSAFGKAFEEIEPSDTDNLPTFYRAILCGDTAGTVVCVDEEDNEVTAYVNAGQIMQGIRPTKIKSTGTSATPLIGIR